MATARLRPRRARPLWLQTEPPPGPRQGHGADVIVARGGDPALLGGGPTRSRRGGHAPERPHGRARMQGPPAEACPDKAPGPLGPQPLHGQAWPPFVPRRRRGRRPPRAACGLPLAQALGHHLAGLPRLAETGAEARRERGALPQAAGLQRPPAVAAVGQHEAWRRQHPGEALAASRPLPCRRRSGARPPAAGFCLPTGAADETPPPLCAGAVAPAPGAPRVPSKAVRRRPTGTARALTAGRVPAAVLPPLGRSRAGEPKALPARLVATDDAGVRGSSQPRRGPSPLLRQDRASTRRPRARPRPRRRPSRDAKVPGRDAEVKGQQQGRRRGRGLLRAGHHGCRHRWTPACIVQPMGSSTGDGASHQRPWCVLSAGIGSQALLDHAAQVLLWDRPACPPHVCRYRKPGGRSPAAPPQASRSGARSPGRGPCSRRAGGGAGACSPRPLSLRPRGAPPGPCSAAVPPGGAHGRHARPRGTRPMRPPTCPRSASPARLAERGGRRARGRSRRATAPGGRAGAPPR